MATQSRQIDSDVERGLIELLKTQPYSVRFFEAVRLLRRVFPDREGVGHFFKPSAEIVRFTAHPSLEFPASEIQSMEWPEDPDAQVEMMVNFMGLAAPNGVLPPTYTELIVERAQKKVDLDQTGRQRFDNGFRDFLDLFNHRFISLFYRAWEKHHFFVSYEVNSRRMEQTGRERTDDRLTSLLLTFIGLGTRGLPRRQFIEDHALAYYAGMLSQSPRSAQALQQILNDYFDVPVEVEQFVGRWIPLSRSDQTCFDDVEAVNLRLGQGAVVGDEIWDRQSTMRVRLGPLSRARYMDFLPLPKSRGYPALKAWLRFYSNDQMDFEVQLVLKREETPGFALDDAAESPLMLGWISWIRNAPLQRDPGETILQM